MDPGTQKQTELNTTGHCARMNARNILKDRIARKQKKLDALQILDKVIPWDLVSAADEERLFVLFCSGFE